MTTIITTGFSAINHVLTMDILYTVYLVFKFNHFQFISNVYPLHRGSVGGHYCIISYRSTQYISTTITIFLTLPTIRGGLDIPHCLWIQLLSSVSWWSISHFLRNKNVFPEFGFNSCAQDLLFLGPCHSCFASIASVKIRV